MAIDKIFDNASVDGIADNLFKSVSNSVSEVKAMQQRKAAENVQLVIQALKKIEGDLRQTNEEVANELATRIASIKDGKDGKDGANAKDGRDGRPGRDGAKGDKGDRGLDGRNGVDGKDGISVTDAKIDFDGSLIISLSTGQEINVGEVVSSALADKIQIISTMSTNGAVGIKDEGTSISTGVKTINFVGAGVTATNSGDDVTVNVSSGAGTVTSVAATVPAFLSVAGSPITTTGTLAISLSGTALPVPNGGTGLTSLTTGYLPFGAGTSALNSSSNLFWDNANTRLGVGTASPAFTLDVNGTINALVSTGYSATTLDRPNVRPSLLLDFADTRLLDPRITFTRASTATFYDQTTSALAEQNLVTYSQDLSNAAWTKNNSTATANYTTAPDGTSTASAFYESAVSSTQHTTQATGNTTSLPVTFSCYLKKGDGVTAPDWIQITTGGGSAAHANFNLTTGLAGNTDATSTITSVGSGWYRCTMTITTSSGGVSFILAFTNNTDSTVRYVSSAYLGVVTSNVFIWGAQLEQRSAVTAYTPTTTAAITNYIPVLQTAASGVARFDCNPTTRESLGLLIEESRTNLLTYSSGFDDASWTKINSASMTTAANIAPDGTQTAQLFTVGGAGARLQKASTVTASTAYTATIYAKAGNAPYLCFGFASSPASSAIFNLATGVVSNTAGSPTATSISSVGNGWYRCTVTATATTTSLTTIAGASSTNTFSSTNYPNGTTGDTGFIWGAQLEAGAFATSYIPTVASQVTRAADAASMTGTNFTSWFNIALGSLYAEYQYNWANSAGGNLKVAAFTPVAAGSYAAINAIGGASTGWFASGVAVGAAVSGSLNKQDISYTSPNTFSASLNGGATVSSTASDFRGTSTALSIGMRNSDQWLNGTIKRIAYYPVALTSTQLQALTS